MTGLVVQGPCRLSLCNLLPWKVDTAWTTDVTAEKLWASRHNITWQLTIWEWQEAKKRDPSSLYCNNWRLCWNWTFRRGLLFIDLLEGALFNDATADLLRVFFIWPLLLLLLPRAIPLHWTCKALKMRYFLNIFGLENLPLYFLGEVLFRCSVFYVFGIFTSYPFTFYDF